MALKVFNTLTRKKETFKPLHPGQVKMYCCGPTVYDFLHVGNFRGAVFYNLVFHWLQESGYEVEFVYNFTDVDDKIINRANSEGVEAKAVAERFIEEFKKDFAALGLTPHSQNPRATEHIENMISRIKELEAKGKAYAVDGEVFYSVRDFAEYGKLSGRKLDDLQAGSRIDVDEKKRDPADFSLWKPAKEGEQSWQSPWGAGRPGWHIECSTMVRALLGEQIDIHGGGLDLLFPHHENEIAQAEGETDKPYVRYWLHNNMFTFDGAKMSKSLGNIRTMRSFLEEYHPEVFKYLVLSSHYRSTAEFSDTTIRDAVNGLARVYSALAVAETFEAGQEREFEPAKTGGLADQFKKLEEKIRQALDDDFNTPVVIGSVFEAVKLFNGKVKRGVPASDKLVAQSRCFLSLVERYGQMLSLFDQAPAKLLRELDDMLLKHKNLERNKIDALVAKRDAARADKDWARSDELRDELAAMGIMVNDLAGGSHWEVDKSS